MSMWIGLPDEEALKLPEKYGAVAMHLGTFEISNFTRLIAKVAHSGAFAASPAWTEEFEPLLPDLILGRSLDYQPLIGGNGARFNSPDPDGMDFPMQFRTIPVDEDRLFVAELRLFAKDGGPVYWVVVGHDPSTKAGEG